MQKKKEKAPRQLQLCASGAAFLLTGFSGSRTFQKQGAIKTVRLKQLNRFTVQQ